MSARPPRHFLISECIRMNSGRLRRVAPLVKPPAWSYNAARRRTAAQRTRREILSAATQLFTERGYVATTMAESPSRQESRSTPSTPSSVASRPYFAC